LCRIADAPDQNRASLHNLAVTNEVDGLEIVPVSAAIWVESVSLDWEHHDLTDRVIVATARLRDAPIVTKDDIMAAFCGRAVW
jgi:PIN domain nuclease of toxin-antitoxin system